MIRQNPATRNFPPPRVFIKFGSLSGGLTHNFVPMIAAATQAKNSLSLDNLPVGWFDLALVVILVFGLFRGRKNGMTKEVIPLFQWISIVVVAGLVYEIVGDEIINLSGWEKLPAYLTAYLALTLVVWIIFTMIKKPLMPRLTGSNFFGHSEYYLGMISGLIRYACILLFALALLNAPFYSLADIRAHQAYVARWYGGGEKGYSGDYFPTIQGIQQSVFENSFTGSFIKKYLDPILINTGSPADQGKPAPQKQPIIHIGK